jgi:hypothetical protein
MSPEVRKPLKDTRSNANAAVDPDTGACKTDKQGFQVSPLDAMFFDPNLSVIPSFSRDMKIWHVLEVEERLLSQAMLAFNNYGPENFAERL